MSDERLDVPQGLLDLLILKTLTTEPRHGWGIAERLRQMTRDSIDIRQGSLYPALHRLERRAWVRSSWGASDNNRRAKYYALTKRGRAQLETKVSTWRKLSAAIVQIVDGV